MKYSLYYTGCASTPNSIGVKNENGVTIEEIDTARPTGKETRKAYEKAKNELKNRYNL